MLLMYNDYLNTINFNTFSLAPSVIDDNINMICSIECKPTKNVNTHCIAIDRDL